MFIIARYQAQLESLGLSSLEGVKAFKGDLVKNHKGRRDIFRIQTKAQDGKELLLFLKRNWKPYKKDGLASLLTRGRVWSLSRLEWGNSKALQAAGLKTAGLVACGEECGPFWEKFSFIITEAATGGRTLEQFLRDCRDADTRRRVFAALASEIQKMHDAGLATPDLFTRHIFVDTEGSPKFCLIDMARVDRARTLSRRRRARDLAALNVTAPMRFVSAGERIRFLREYSGGNSRALFKLIRRRVEHLLSRRKFRDFQRSED